MRPVVVRTLHASLLLTVLLAGCSNASVIQIVDGHVTAANGARTSSGSCDGDALVQVTGSGQSGSIRVSVKDNAGAKVYDSGSLSGNGVDQSLHVEGAKGQWTLEVQRNAYTGSYTAQVVC